MTRRAVHYVDSDNFGRYCSDPLHLRRGRLLWAPSQIGTAGANP